MGLQLQMFTEHLCSAIKRALARRPAPLSESIARLNRQLNEYALLAFDDLCRNRGDVQASYVCEVLVQVSEFASQLASTSPGLLALIRISLEADLQQRLSQSSSVSVPRTASSPTIYPLQPQPAVSIAKKGQLLAPELSDTSAENGLPNREVAHTADTAGENGVLRGIEPQARAESSEQTNRRAMVDGFIDKMLAEKARSITRKNIWTVAGYRHQSEFERFQRGDNRTTQTAIAKFNRVLKMKPDDFIRVLDKTGK